MGPMSWHWSCLQRRMFPGNILLWFLATGKQEIFPYQGKTHPTQWILDEETHSEFLSSGSRNVFNNVISSVVSDILHQKCSWFLIRQTGNLNSEIRHILVSIDIPAKSYRGGVPRQWFITVLYLIFSAYNKHTAQTAPLTEPTNSNFEALITSQLQAIEL